MSEQRNVPGLGVTPVKLAHLQLLPLVTGVQTVTLAEFKHLDRQNFEPVLICKEPGPLTDAMTHEGVHSEFVPSLIRPISPWHDLRALFQLNDRLQAIRPSILHTHSSKTGILGRLAGRLKGVPAVVHTVHGFAFPYATSRLVRWTYYLLEYLGGKLCDAVIVLSEEDRQIAVRKLRLAPAKVHLIPNGVDLAAYGAGDEESRRKIRAEVFHVYDRDTVCIGMVGRLWRQKNPLCLLRAAQRVLQNSHGSSVKFIFIGDGELRSELEREIAEAGLQEHIQLLGWRTDVPTLLQSLDIFALPSMWEGMPLAILEAMASSLPCVVSNIPGNRDLVADAREGYLFPSDDDERMADRLLELLRSPEARVSMGTRARAKVAAQFTLAHRNDRIQELYRLLLAPKADVTIEATEEPQ
jgi:glycosyltransferase involved in cell wall biosynthesis